MSDLFKETFNALEAPRALERGMQDNCDGETDMAGKQGAKMALTFECVPAM